MSCAFSARGTGLGTPSSEVTSMIGGSKVARWAVGGVCALAGLAGAYHELCYPSECHLFGSRTAAHLLYVAASAAFGLGGFLLVVWERLGCLLLACTFLVGALEILFVRCATQSWWEKSGGAMLMLLLALAVWGRAGKTPDRKANG